MIGNFLPVTMTSEMCFGEEKDPVDAGTSSPPKCQETKRILIWLPIRGAGSDEDPPGMDGKFKSD
jgi:hypothetical protein